MHERALRSVCGQHVLMPARDVRWDRRLPGPGSAGRRVAQSSCLFVYRAPTGWDGEAERGGEGGWRGLLAEGKQGQRM